MRRLIYPNNAKKAAVLAITQIASLAASPKRVLINSGIRRRLGLPPFLPAPRAPLHAARASKTGKFCAMKRKIAKPAATIESVTATSLHFGM